MKRRTIICDTWRLYDNQISMSINKVLLGHSHDGFHPVAAELGSNWWQRLYMAQKVKDIYYLAL